MSDTTQLTTLSNGNNSAFTNVQTFEAAWRMAKALSAASLVPERYRENPSDSLIALEMAQRIGASPLMVMQNLYVVHGNPTWSAKFKIATFNMCGRFGPVQYEWRGKEGETQYGCRAYSVDKKTNETVRGPWIDWQLVQGEGWDRKSGSKWKTMPQKMFMLRAASWLIDVLAPEISMGLPTTEEAQEIIDIDPSTGEVIASAKPNTATKSIGDKLKKRADAIKREQAQNGNGGDMFNDGTRDELEQAVDRAADILSGKQHPGTTMSKRQIIEIVNNADAPDVLAEMQEVVDQWDKRTSDYKELNDLIMIRMEEMS